MGLNTAIKLGSQAIFTQGHAQFFKNSLPGAEVTSKPRKKLVLINSKFYTTLQGQRRVTPTKPQISHFLCLNPLKQTGSVSLAYRRCPMTAV
jgi:hypothetical protein